MTDAELPPPVQAKPRRGRVNLALAGALAASTDQTWDEIAPQVGAASGTSLKSNCHRHGVTMQRVRSEPSGAVALAFTAKVATEAADLIRERLNGELLAQTAALGQRRPSLKGLSSKGQGRAATVKAIAETWRTLNGSPDSITFSFGASAQAGPAPVERVTVDVRECATQSQAADEHSA